MFAGTGAAIRREVFDKIGGFWEFGFEEINIVVAGAGVCSGEDEDDIAAGGIVNSGLNVIEIVRPLFIDDDYLCRTGNS